MLASLCRTRGALRVHGPRQFSSATANARAFATPKLLSCGIPRSFASCSTPHSRSAALLRAVPCLPVSPLKRALSSSAGGGVGSGSQFERLYTTRTRLLSLLNAANENRFVLLTIGGALVACYGYV